MNSDRPDRAPDNPNHAPATEQFADAVLNAALAQYSRSEPRLGLETRVLRRLDEAREQRARGWFARWPWPAAAVAAAAVLAIAAFLAVRPNRVAPPPSPLQTANRAAPPPAAVPAVTPEQVATLHVPEAVRRPRFNRVRPGARNVARALSPASVRGAANVARIPSPTLPAEAPKLAQFPAPAPATHEEMTLAQAAASATPATLHAIAAAQQPIQDLRIPELQIEPLAPPPPLGAGAVPNR